MSQGGLPIGWSDERPSTGGTKATLVCWDGV